MRADDVLYPFSVGSIACTMVKGVDVTYDPEAYFGSPPAEELAQALHEYNLDPVGKIPSPYPVVLVNTGSHRVLVDAGSDPVEFPAQLQRTGTRPEEIDMVIITHAHPDHLGGATTAEGAPIYPSARYVMATKEWEFWMAEPRPGKVGMWGDGLRSFARERLPLIRDRLDLVEPDQEVLPGVALVAAPGHTPGQMAVAVSSDTDELLIISDVVFHPIHL